MFRSALFGTVLGALAGAAGAATAVYEDFESGPGAWGPNTVDTSTAQFPVGGNPGGWLGTDNLLGAQGFGVIGAVATTGDYVGALPDGSWTASVDVLELINFSGIDEVRLRWRYQDPTFNGWYYPIVQGGMGLLWNSYAVTFDTNWSDAEALGAGWVQEPGSVPFATLWNDIWSAEVRFVGTPGGTYAGGIDNYRMRPAPVPLPAGVLLLCTGLAGLGLLRRRG